MYPTNFNRPIIFIATVTATVHQANQLLDNYCILYFFVCRSHRFYRAFYVPILSKKHNTYADYVILINKVLFEKIKRKLTPDYKLPLSS